MAQFQVSKSSNGKAWRAEIRRPNVSATVWELIAPEAEYKTATQAREAIEARYGVKREWQRTMGRGSAYYRTATHNGRSNDALPVRFIVDSCDEVTAIFPTLCGTNAQDVTCYAHIGQHGSAIVEWANSRNHRDATAEERERLELELIAIYENGRTDELVTLFVVDTINRDWMRIARSDSYTRGR